MYIGLNSLKRAKPQDVIRLATFMGIVTLGHVLEDVMWEIVKKTNPLKAQSNAWYH